MINFSELCIERPLGTKENTALIDLLSRSFIELDYKTIELPIDCTVWQSNTSFLEQNGNKTTIFPGPFSKELKGNYPVKYVSTINELQNVKDFNGVLIFHDELSKNSIMSKNFPFYFPDGDKLMYETLEKINPKGIIAITGQDPASGLNPFPIFYDANFGISTSYVSSLDNFS
jgi:aminopeptidase YwaD